MCMCVCVCVCVCVCEPFKKSEAVPMVNDHHSNVINWHQGIYVHT